MRTDPFSFQSPRELARLAARFYALGVSTETANLLAAFERLSPAEQREFTAVIVRRAAQIEYGEITDEELTASAARVFEMLDKEEDAAAR